MPLSRLLTGDSKASQRNPITEETLKKPRKASKIEGKAAQRKVKHKKNITPYSQQPVSLLTKLKSLFSRSKIKKEDPWNTSRTLDLPPSHWSGEASKLPDTSDCNEQDSHQSIQRKLSLTLDDTVMINQAPPQDEPGTSSDQSNHNPKRESWPSYSSTHLVTDNLNSSTDSTKTDELPSNNPPPQSRR